jgi:hypothetical protein
MLRICAFRRPPAGLVEKSRRLLSLKLIPLVQKLTPASQSYYYFPN